MIARGRELVAAEEPTVLAKPLLDPIVVEDGQSDGGLPDPPCADEGDWGEVFRETNNVGNQLVASEKDPRRRGRTFSGSARCKRQIQCPLAVKITDLV